MIKKFVLACTLTSIALSGTAAVFTDVDDWTGNEIVLGVNRPMHSFTDNFNLADDGYTPGTHITSAIARFTVRDENRNEAEYESFVVHLGDDYFTEAGPSNFPFGSNTVALTVGGNLIATMLFDLEQDGILWYTITATQGDFRFKTASLEATVPDAGASVVILGLGLLAVGGFRRFTTKNA